MLSSISFSPSHGSLSLDKHQTDRPKRITEAVYALCVVAIGVLFLITAV